MSSDPLTPSVSWAQRPKIVFVTINVSDVNNPDIKVRNQKKKITQIIDSPFYDIILYGRLKRILCTSKEPRKQTRKFMS